MAPKRETGARVVGHEVLSLGWSRQNRRSCLYRRVAQDVRSGLDSSDLPVSVAAMAGERLQRSGRGEAFQVVPVEPGTAGEIADAVERSDFSRGDKGLRARLRQALSEAEAQADRPGSLCPRRPTA